MGDSLYYKPHSGKPNKLVNFTLGFLRASLPSPLFRIRLKAVLREVEHRDDRDYILRRVDYYIRLDRPFQLPVENQVLEGFGWKNYVGPIGAYKRNFFHTAYYLDQQELTRWFNPKLRWSFLPGDVYFTPKWPSIVKSRLLTTENQNSVVLKLDKLRHFMFVNDPVPFAEKQNRVIFRGQIRSSRVRKAFIEKFVNHPLVDCGVVGRDYCPPEWRKPKRTIREHFDYKFIMALEGNDVASNLKWVMSSNSIAVMTRPTCETWFMEGTLKPGYHYIEVKEDYSDFEEKIRYYSEHTDEAEEIVRHAHEYVKQFFDKHRETLISLLVLDRYFRLSGQK